MHILHVVSFLDPALGGPSTATLGLTSAQVEVGLRVTVLSSFRRTEDLRLREKLAAKGVKVITVGPTLGPTAWHPNLRALVAAQIADTDIVHIHGLWESIQLLAARAAVKQGKPYLIEPCGMLDPWSIRQKTWKKSLYLRFFLRRYLDAAARIHCTSMQEAAHVAELRFRAQVVVLPNGIALEEFSPLPQRGAFRQLHPSLAGKKILLFLGRLHPKKGLDLLIAAFASLHRADLVLVIAGPEGGAYAEELRQQCRVLGAASQVIFVGMLRGREKVAAFVDADLFALTSHDENFGIAVIEALAAGTPVLLSDQVGIQREVIAAGVGTVVSLSVERIRSALVRWMDSEPKSEDLAKRCREFALASYDWRQIAAGWKLIYADLWRLESESKATR